MRSQFVPGFQKNVFGWCVKSKSWDVDFLSLMSGRYWHWKIRNVSTFEFLIFLNFLILEPGAKKTLFPKASSENGVFFVADDLFFWGDRDSGPRDRGPFATFEISSANNSTLHQATTTPPWCTYLVIWSIFPSFPWILVRTGKVP